MNKRSLRFPCLALLMADHPPSVTEDWDFAVEEVENSRDFLSGRISELSHAATPEAWADAKEKIGEAWHRSQMAVDRLSLARTV